MQTSAPSTSSKHILYSVSRHTTCRKRVAKHIKLTIFLCRYSYSIVQDYNTYWVRTPSDPVRVMQPPVAEGEVNYQLNGPQSLSIACVWTCVSRPPSIIQPASVPGNVPDKPFYLKDNDEEDTEPSRVSTSILLYISISSITAKFSEYMQFWTTHP